MSNQRSTHLVAYAIVAASTQNIPANGTWTQLTLLDPKGVAIPGNTLPGQCTFVQLGGTGYVLGVDASATPTWMVVCDSQSNQLDVVLGGAGKKVAISSESATAITTGNFFISFFA